MRFNYYKLFRMSQFGSLLVQRGEVPCQSLPDVTLAGVTNVSELIV